MKLKALKVTRVARSKTQMGLEVETGIDQVVISRIERGEVKATEEQKRKLAKALRTPLKVLFPTKRKEKKSSAATLLTGLNLETDN